MHNSIMPLILKVLRLLRQSADEHFHLISVYKAVTVFVKDLEHDPEAFIGELALLAHGC